MIVSNKVTILGKSLLSSTALVAGFLVVSVTSTANAADPVVNGSFVGGSQSGTFTNTDNLTTITVHKDNTIANFDQYNIGANQEVHYQHDLGINGNVNHLSRVTGGNESRILGKLTSDNVNVFLVNPNGIFFGKNATVNVPSLIASTADISDSNFKAGNYKFDKAGNADAKIVNNGTITIKDGGLAALVAPGVENNGVIVARQGKVALAGGDEFTLDLYGDKLLSFAVSQNDNDRYVKQSGDIIAKEGLVALTTQDADSVVKNVINLDGYVEANTVTLAGKDIVLGTDSKIVANDGKGNGGTVIAKATNSLKADGEINASGTGAGKGGFVETSAEELYLGENLSVKTTTDTGKYGEWLIDPTNYTISTGIGGLNSINNTVLSALLIGTNITLQTSALGGQAGDINVNADVTKIAGGQTTLSLVAHNNVNVANGVTIGAVGGAKLNVNLVAKNDVNVNGNINTNGGNLTTGKTATYSGLNVTGVTDNSASFTNNGTINAGTGNVTVNADTINVDNTIKGNVVALNTNFDTEGQINLAAKLTANTLSSDTKLVNVKNDNAVINQGVQLVNDGGVVNIAAGTYDQSVFVNKDITLAGAASGGTIIKPTDASKLNKAFESSDNWNEKNRAIILVQGKNSSVPNATVKDITVDGSGIGSLTSVGSNYDRLVGIAYDDAGGVIDHVTVQNIANNSKGNSAGIFANSSYLYDDKSANPAATGTAKPSDDTSRKLTINNSTVKDYAYKGISVKGDLIKATITNNTISSADAEVGIELALGAKGKITGNTITNDSSSNGSYFGNSSDILLDRAGTNILVDDNTITGGVGKSGIGIQLSSTDGATVSNNKVANEKTGIYVLSSKNNKVQGNTVEDNTTGVVVAAVNAAQSSGNTLVSNIIKNNTTGVTLLSSNVSLTGDVITGGTTGLQVSGKTAATSFGAGVEFDGQSDQYISLEKKAMDDQELDATQVKFGGIKGSEATDDDQLVAIEDKLHHELDDTNVGLIYFKAKTVVATENNLGIQAAVNSATAGDTVLVGKGEYDESVIINKDLTLDGAGDGAGVVVKPLTQASLDNVFISSYEGNEYNKSILLVQNTANVTIKDLTVDGSEVATGYLKSTPTGNYERLVGIGFDNAGGAVDNVDVTKIADDSRKLSTGIFIDSNSTYEDKSGNPLATGISNPSSDDSRTVTVKNSTVSDYQYSGITANGDKVTATIGGAGTDKNTVTSNEAKAGIVLSRGAKGSIINNTIVNDSTSFGSFAGNSSDILLDRAGDGILVDRNTIVAGNNHGIGIQVASTNKATITNNDILNEKTGVLLVSSNNNTVEANQITNNYDGIVAVMATGNDIISNDLNNNSNTGVSLLLSDSNNLTDNDISRNGEGVYIRRSNGNKLELNNITNNTNAGIHLDRANNNSSTSDIISDNGTGVYIYNSDLNKIDLATISNNDVGVSIAGGSDNTSITNTNINGAGDIGLLVDGNNAPITLTLTNVVFGGTQTDAAIRFQNATTVDGVTVKDVILDSTAPLGWEFVNVKGGPVTDVLDAGDMNFGNTVFGDQYSVQSIQLTNSPMDGDATNATFVNDGNNPFTREDRVHHTLDVPAEGTIFYNGFNIVAANFGNLFGNIARRIDLREVYYNPVSTAGVAYDNPAISGVAKATTFNSTNDFRVSLNGGVAGSPSNAAGQATQYAANNIASANPADLNNLETAATGGAAGGDLQNLETAAGGNAQSCEVNFANDFLGEDVLLANASGTCSTGNAAQVQ